MGVLNRFLWKTMKTLGLVLFTFTTLLFDCSAEKTENRVKRGLAHWGHADVNIPDSWQLEDNVGVFGDFRISRNVTTVEGCKVCCKYMIHYDKLANQIQFVGRRQGVRCFKQHCIKITHILYSRNSIKKTEFIETMRDRLGN